MVERLSAGGGREGDGFVGGRRSARAAAEVVDFGGEVGQVGCGDLWCGRGERGEEMGERARERGGKGGSVFGVGDGLRDCCFGLWLM